MAGIMEGEGSITISAIQKTGTDTGSTLSHHQFKYTDPAIINKGLETLEELWC